MEWEKTELLAGFSQKKARPRLHSTCSTRRIAGMLALVQIQDLANQK